MPKYRVNQSSFANGEIGENFSGNTVQNPIYSRSVSYLENFYPDPSGAIKTRQATKEILNLDVEGKVIPFVYQDRIFYLAYSNNFCWGYERLNRGENAEKTTLGDLSPGISGSRYNGKSFRYNSVFDSKDDNLATYNGLDSELSDETTINLLSNVFSPGVILNQSLQDEDLIYLSRSIKNLNPYIPAVPNTKIFSLPDYFYSQDLSRNSGGINTSSTIFNRLQREFNERFEVSLTDEVSSYYESYYFKDDLAHRLNYGPVNFIPSFMTDSYFIVLTQDENEELSYVPCYFGLDFLRDYVFRNAEFEVISYEDKVVFYDKTGRNCPFYFLFENGRFALLSMSPATKGDQYYIPQRIPFLDRIRSVFLL